jgi:hypothetical protein
MQDAFSFLHSGRTQTRHFHFVWAQDALILSDLLLGIARHLDFCMLLPVLGRIKDSCL